MALTDDGRVERKNIECFVSSRNFLQTRITLMKHKPWPRLKFWEFKIEFRWSYSFLSHFVSQSEMAFKVAESKLELEIIIEQTFGHKLQFSNCNSMVVWLFKKVLAFSVVLLQVTLNDRWESILNRYWTVGAICFWGKKLASGWYTVCICLPWPTRSKVLQTNRSRTMMARSWMEHNEIDFSCGLVWKKSLQLEIPRELRVVYHSHKTSKIAVIIQIN